MKAPIRLRGCAGWSGTSLSTIAWRQVFTWCCPVNKASNASRVVFCTSPLLLPILTWFPRVFSIQIQLLNSFGDTDVNKRLSGLIWSGNESQRETTYHRKCAPDEDSKQHTHPRSLIKVCIVCMKKLCIVGYPKCKIQINLRKCKKSESMLGAHGRRYVFWRIGPNRSASIHDKTIIHLNRHITKAVPSETYTQRRFRSACGRISLRREIYGLHVIQGGLQRLIRLHGWVRWSQVLTETCSHVLKVHIPTLRRQADPKSSFSHVEKAGWSQVFIFSRWEDGLISSLHLLTSRRQADLKSSFAHVEKAGWSQVCIFLRWEDRLISSLHFNTQRRHILSCFGS